MSEFDTMLKQLKEMCKMGIDLINDNRGLILQSYVNKENHKIITHLDDAYKNIQLAKEELDKFKELAKPDDIFCLLNVKRWNKRGCGDVYEILGLDLRSMTVHYSCFDAGSTLKYARDIKCFLNEFEPL